MYPGVGTLKTGVAVKDLGQMVSVDTGWKCELP
jgi:hypothetical protein